MARDRTGVVDDAHLRPILKKVAPRLAQRCGREAVALFAERFKETTSPVADQSSYVFRAAIEEHAQDAHKDGYRNTILDGLRDTALALVAENDEIGEQVVEELLRSDYTTLVRVGIYICGERYGTVGKAFWRNFRAEWFLELSYWHEVYWFIKKGFSRFSGVERGRYLEAVRSIRGDWREGVDQEEMDDTHRRDLLHPAVGQGDAEVDALYQSLVSRLGPVRDHPDFHVYSSGGGWIGERSPLESEKVLTMSADELRAFMLAFRPNARDWEGPTLRGFAGSIAAAVRASEDGFTSRFEIFKGVPRAYQHGLFRGLKERWSDDKRPIDWKGALALAQELVTDPLFHTEMALPAGGWEPNVFWLASDISDLIKSGASDRDRPLSVQEFMASVKVLQTVIASSDLTAAGESKDAVSHAINSTRGRALEGLINVALALRREGQAEEEVWKVIGPTLDDELATSELGKNADFAAIAGLYTPNLHYLKPDWVEENFDRIFSNGSEAAWNCAAAGFAYQRYMYDWLFKRLAAGGHLRRMLSAEVGGESVTEKAVQFLALAYLNGVEPLGAGSLLEELVTSLDSKHLSQLSWFLWTLRGSNARSEQAKKIIDLWLRVADVVRASGRQHPSIQSSLSLLAAFIDKLDAAIERVWSEAAPHANVKHHGYVLIENLARLAPVFPTQTARVMMAALEGFVPDYKREDIVRAVTEIAAAGAVEDAEAICNAFAQRGSNVLKGVYEDIRRRSKRRDA